MKKKTKLQITDLDAVIVFRSDGTYETSMPEFAGDEVPDHLLTTGAVVYALQNPDMMDLIFEHFEKVCRDIKEPETLSLFPGLKN